MNEINEKNIVHTCNFCGATSDDGKTECLIMAPDGTTLICNACIAQCEAMLLDRKRTDIDFRRFTAIQPLPTSNKLRPITRVPKTWVICETHLFKTIPSITACSRDGSQTEEFSIPKQLALWMISYNEQKDIDKIRDSLKDDLKRLVRTALLRYWFGEKGQEPLGSDYTKYSKMLSSIESLILLWPQLAIDNRSHNKHASSTWHGRISK